MKLIEKQTENLKSKTPVSNEHLKEIRSELVNLQNRYNELAQQK
jgi:hypothetical protein